MKFLDKLTVTPLLYACGVLLLAVLGLTVRLHFVGADLDVAKAQVGTAESQRDAARTERDAWKQRAEDAQLANRAADAAIGSLHNALEQQQAQCAANQQANAKAIARARADAADADAALRKFTAQFQTESRKADGGRALAALERACPLMRGY